MSLVRIILGILLVGYGSHAALRLHPDATENEFENIFSGENYPFRYGNWLEYDTPEYESGIIEKRNFAERRESVKSAFLSIINFLNNACEELTCKKERSVSPLLRDDEIVHKYKFKDIDCACEGRHYI